MAEKRSAGPRRSRARAESAKPPAPPTKEVAAPIDAERAREHALVSTRRRWIGGGDELRRVADGRLDDSPLVINDLDGRPLFYEFEVRDREEVVGTVRASASQELGPSVLSTQLGARRWEPGAALRAAPGAVRELYRGQRVRVGAADLVCYCWPKIGVRVRFSSAELGERSIVLDASDLLPIERYGGDQPEGSTAYSFYAEQVEPELELRRRRWQREEEDLAIVRETVPEIMDEGIAIDGELRDLLATRLHTRVTLDKLVLTHQQTVRFGPRCSPHECMELYSQQTDVYCAVATGQMILDFYKWHFSQDQIAATMGTDSGGTSQSGQIAGYEGRSNGCLDATLDETAAWSEAVAEINANRPFKSGIPGHARCGAGYERSWSFSKFGFDRWLKVYDPWPWNADICQGGAITWEDWDAVNHTNFIYVRHRATNHG
jgi:hypothetical protein